MRGVPDNPPSDKPSAAKPDAAYASAPAPAKTGAFPETAWTVMTIPPGASPEQRQRVMERFLARYFEAFKGFVRWRFRVQESDVEDLVQGFILDRLVAKDLLSHVDRDRGKLRSFMQKSLEFYCIDQLRKRTDRPYGEEVLDTKGEQACHQECVFDAQWARHVIQTAADRTRDEYVAKGRADIWRVFESQWVTPLFTNQPKTTYADLSRELDRKEEELSGLLVTGKRAYIRHLKRFVAEYVPQEMVEEELADLQRVLAQALRHDLL